MDYLKLKTRLEAQLEAKRIERDEEIRRRHSVEGLSLAELGRLYSLTRERVRQIVLSGTKH